MNQTDDTRPTYVMPINRVKVSTIIGIDPDIYKSGVAILNTTSRQFTKLANLTLPQLIKLIQSYQPTEVKFIVEAGHLNKSTWHTPPGVHAWNGKSAWLHGAKIGKDVGRNHKTGEMITEILKDWGYQVQEVKPDTSKWDADFFNLQTGYTGRSNEENRDAGKLAWLYQ